MKKITILFAIAVFTIPLFAQGVRLGLTASPQLSWLKSDASSISSNGTHLGFNFGLLTDFFFAERYSLSTGLMINNTGGSLKYADSLRFKTSDITYNLIPNSVIKYKIQYIDIPIAFKMESNQIGYFVYYAQFGISNHLRVGASADIEGVYEPTDGSANTEISLNGAGCKDEVSFFNMGYNIGVGVNYYFSKNTAVTFGILYTNGFIDVTNNSDKKVKDNALLRSVTLKLGVLF